MAWGIQRAAFVLGQLGRQLQAAGLLGAADKALERLGGIVPADPHEVHGIQEVKALRRSMGEEPFAAAHRAGSTLSLEEAVTLALEEAASLEA